MSPNIAYAAKVLNELNKPTIVIKGVGNSLATAVTAAEILTRRFKGLREVASLDSIKIVNKYEPPLEEGLDEVVETHNVHPSRVGRYS